MFSDFMAHKLNRFSEAWRISSIFIKIENNTFENKICTYSEFDNIDSHNFVLCNKQNKSHHLSAHTHGLFLYLYFSHSLFKLFQMEAEYKWYSIAAQAVFSTSWLWIHSSMLERLRLLFLLFHFMILTH